MERPHSSGQTTIDRDPKLTATTCGHRPQLLLCIICSHSLLDERCAQDSATLGDEHGARGTGSMATVAHHRGTQCRAPRRPPSVPSV
eukprot:COSAG01_NODE_2767_length_7108_cov_96.465402_4_plen_87_part_00